VKINISRQHIYLISASLFLLLFVIIFSLSVLIPAGKEYRVKRVELKKTAKKLREYENFYDETFDTLKDLQSKNRMMITAFKATFNPLRFEKQHKKHFTSLYVSEVNFSKIKDEFAVYEVNTTSKISSPSSFYDFLEAVNKSDWIIGVNFPIIFKREGDLIKSSFTMKVYANNRDTNKTASASEAR